MNPFPVKADPNTDAVVLTVTFWRPQRSPMPGGTCPPPVGAPCAPADWIDIGGLDYQAIISDIGYGCPASTVSTTDPDLTPARSTAHRPPGSKIWLQASPRARQIPLTYTVNFTQCLASDGMSWEPGTTHGLDFTAVTPSGVDNASQSVFFELQA